MASSRGSYGVGVALWVLHCLADGGGAAGAGVENTGGRFETVTGREEEDAVVAAAVAVAVAAETLNLGVEANCGGCGCGPDWHGVGVCFCFCDSACACDCGACWRLDNKKRGCAGVLGVGSVALVMSRTYQSAFWKTLTYSWRWHFRQGFVTVPWMLAPSTHQEPARLSCLDVAGPPG